MDARSLSSDDCSLDDRRAQLIDIMSQRFLQGLDFDYVNYEEIDSCTMLDNDRWVEQDAQDRYFNE
jgi:hypothetical protein